MPICLCVCRAKSLQSCPTPCHPMDCSLPGSSVHGDSPGKNPGMGSSVFQSSQPASLTHPALADRFFTTRAIREVPIHLYICSETNHRALILCQTLIKEIQSHPRKNKSFILIKRHPSISTHPQVNELATWTVAGCSLFVFLAHRYSSPPTFPRHACSLLPFVFPELYFLCYCQINSISGYFKLASVYFFI